MKQDILSATQNTVSMGDVNGDGAVDYFDIAAFHALDAGGAANAVGSAVPEPSTMALAVVGLLGLLTVIRRRAA